MGSIIDRILESSRIQLQNRLDREWSQSKRNTNWDTTEKLVALSFYDRTHTKLLSLIKLQKLTWITLNQFKSYQNILNDLLPDWNK